jgi:hypothetical protein
MEAEHERKCGMEDDFTCSEWGTTGIMEVPFTNMREI